jgi:hypothetical protein
MKIRLPPCLPLFCVHWRRPRPSRSFKDLAHLGAASLVLRRLVVGGTKACSGGSRSARSTVVDAVGSSFVVIVILDGARHQVIDLVGRLIYPARPVCTVVDQEVAVFGLWSSSVVVGSALAVGSSILPPSPGVRLLKQRGLGCAAGGALFVDDAWPRRRSGRC